MPTNLPPICAELEKKYRAARSLPEKIKALEEYINSIPEHKGTMKLRAHLKTRLAKLRDEQEEARKRRKALGGGRTPYDIDREGAARVVLLGLTQSGKSELLKALTNVDVEVGSHPYTTSVPVAGMMDFEDIQIQIVEAPALMEGAAEGRAWGLSVLGLARNSDGIILLIDGSKDLSEQLNLILGELEAAAIYPESERTFGVEIERTGGGGIKVFSTSGRFVGGVHKIPEILRNSGINNALVKIWGEVDEEDLKKAILQHAVFKPFMVVVNKLDHTPPAALMDDFVREVGDRFETVGVSAKTGMNIELLKHKIFSFLGILRVYTRRPGQPGCDKPFILRRGSKIIDLAAGIHSDFERRFRFARIWGPSAKFPGERVGADTELRDGDIVEIYMR
ncbi:MAG: TGS domain-containing protein [Candidatus Bathyarchaeia archaeon]